MGSFEQETAKIDIDQRCIQSGCGKFKNSPLNTCFFGVPSNELYGRIPLQKVPDNIPKIMFLMGVDQVGVVEAFIHSEHCKTVNSLVVGNSSYSRNIPFSYSPVISLFKDANFPELKNLSLGEWVLFHNANGVSGRLGDITEVLRKLSHIERLDLWGEFELTEPLDFSNLKEFNFDNAGPVFNATLSVLMNSSFPKLEDLYFDMDCENFLAKPETLDMDCEGYKTSYTFPESFLQGNGFPQLCKLEITGGFAPGEKERLIDSPLGKRVATLFLDDME